MSRYNNVGHGREFIYCLGRKLKINGIKIPTPIEEEILRHHRVACNHNAQTAAVEN